MSGVKVPCIIWTCDACGKLIADDDGGPVIYRDEVWEAEEWNRRLEFLKFEDDVSRGGTVDDSCISDKWGWTEETSPRKAKWKSLHNACRVHRDDVYEIDACLLRDYKSVLSRTLMTAESGWTELTDWTDFIRKHAFNNKPQRH